MSNQKPFKLRISDLDNAARISREWATHTVSILDTDLAKKTIDIVDSFYEQRIPQPSPGMLLHRCHFDDVTPEDDFGLIATLEDIKAILQFTVKLTTPDKLLVHCGAGISRSTAVACGILCQHGLSPKEALKMVCLLRQGAYPNDYIITLMDEALELKGLLKKTLYGMFDY
ncbi:MAG: hypothetical protein BWK79_07970 [Beggiatoa sp. IS2]|nr:MAG: hypothetical protein BWK79_07970 [Beggiatoa sp. IS2]